MSVIDIRSRTGAVARLWPNNPKNQSILHLDFQIREVSCKYLIERSESSKQDLLLKHAKACTQISSLFLDEALEFVSTHGWISPEIMELVTLYNRVLSSTIYEPERCLSKIHTFKSSVSEDGSERAEAITTICDHMHSLLETKKQQEQNDQKTLKNQIQNLVTLYEESQKLPKQIQELYHKVQPAILALYKHRTQETSRMALQGKSPTQNPSPLKILQETLQKTVDCIDSSQEPSNLRKLLSISSFFEQELHSSHQAEPAFSPTIEEPSSPSDMEHKSQAFALPHEREVFALCNRIQHLCEQGNLHIHRIASGEYLLLKHLLNLCITQEQTASTEETIDCRDIHTICHFITQCTPEALDALKEQDQKIFLHPQQTAAPPSTSPLTKTNTSKSSDKHF